MINTKLAYNIFKKGSRTYFHSSLFFPKHIRDRVTVLYAFVRYFDDMVDNIPQEQEKFLQKKFEYLQAFEGKTKANDFVIDNFITLETKYDFDHQWPIAFLQSMESDLNKSISKNSGELVAYIYGSAEVIGLMMAKILNLSPTSLQSAAKLGHAMQLLNFIRDIEIDLQLGRTYMPEDYLAKFKLKDLEFETVVRNKKRFESFVRFEIEKYEKIQEKAEKGFKYLPKKYLVPIKTASDMYKWTARQIYKNPIIIYNEQVKPSKFRIFIKGISNYFSC